MDVQGPSVVKPYVTKYGVTFPVAVDTADVFGSSFGLKAIPVSYYIDEVGIVRLAGAGPHPQFLQQVVELLDEPFLDLRGKQPKLPAALAQAELERRIAANPEDWQSRLALARIFDAAGRGLEAVTQLQAAAKAQPRNAEVSFVWGMVLWNQKQKDAALAKLKHARDLDPQNWRIRKQIWAIENPEKFYTGHAPDYSWQKEALAKEQGKSPGK